MNGKDTPHAAPGLDSYRVKGRFGWILVGANSATDALREGGRSSDAIQPETLEVWAGDRFLAVED